MKIYIAAPLFNEMELARNKKFREELRAEKFETYLPQEDGGIAFDQISAGADTKKIRKELFELDTREVAACDVLVCLLDGRVPDEGLCIELGMAYALGKSCYGYMTDKRSLDAYGINLMIEGCLSDVAHSMNELKEMLRAQSATLA